MSLKIITSLARTEGQRNRLSPLPEGDIPLFLKAIRVVSKPKGFFPKRSIIRLAVTCLPLSPPMPDSGKHQRPPAALSTLYLKLSAEGGWFCQPPLAFIFSPSIRKGITPTTVT